jgi:adenosylhomocysteine nucleosidase
MRILVTLALETEIAPWRALREFRTDQWGEADVYRAQIGAAEVGVLLTGAGPKQAHLETAKVLGGDPDSIHLCITSGLAGALKPEYRIGQVLAARSVRTENELTDPSSNLLESSAPLLSFAGDCGATVVEQFYSAVRVVGKAEEKSHLGERSDAVEMESFEVLLESAAYGIPAIAIRAVSDSVDDDLPLDMNRIFTDEGQVSIPRVLGQVALHPTSVPELVRLGQNSKVAAESLANFLDKYITMVSGRFQTLERRTGAAAS